MYVARAIEQAVKSFGSATSGHVGSKEQFEARFYLHMLRAYWKNTHKIFIENVWQIVGEEFVRNACTRAETALDELLTQPALINRLLAEPPMRTTTRARLKSEIDDLCAGIKLASEARGI
jgi:hypothetical protein